MKCISTMLITIALASTVVSCGSPDEGISDLSSNYPPNYSWGERCADSAEFYVCRSYSYSAVYMQVFYKGQLKNNGNLSLVIKVNGNEGVFPMESGGYTDPIVRLGNGPMNCHSVYNEVGYGRYECDEPTDSMRHVLYFAKDGIGRMNALDIELAVVDGNGNWDSRGGANYRYRIERSY